MMVSEYDSQSVSPVDAVTGANGSGTTAASTLQTSEGDDLIYVACASPSGTTGASNYAMIATGPTVEFRSGAVTPGSESASCLLVGSGTTWVIQEMAIKH